MAKTIKLDHITKIEGHARLDVKVERGEVKMVHMDVFEGARYFEGILKGRMYDEASHLTSRICGICSQSHLLTSVKAVENALGVKVTEQTDLLREMLMMGQNIQSHVLHLFFLALPDYLGYESAIAMAKKYKKEVQMGLTMKKLANDICTVIGGREIHSMTVAVGGFSWIPTQKMLDELLIRLKKGKPLAVKTAELFAKIKYPDFERDIEFLALRKPDTYAILHGNLASTRGLYISTDKYKDHIIEKFRNTTTAKLVYSGDNPYMVGSLARLNLNYRMLSPDARKIIEKSGIRIPSRNPYLNNFAQAVELVHFFDRAIEILSSLKVKPEEPVEFKVKAGHGVSATEVPRGTLFHEYEIDDKGYVVKTNIISPTTQNLRNIEDDIKVLLPTILHKKKESEVVMEIEKLIRAYDPCISCSAHFLELNIDES